MDVQIVKPTEHISGPPPAAPPSATETEIETLRGVLDRNEHPDPASVVDRILALTHQQLGAEGSRPVRSVPGVFETDPLERDLDALPLDELGQPVVALPSLPDGAEWTPADQAVIEQLRALPPDVNPRLISEGLGMLAVIAADRLPDEALTPEAQILALKARFGSSWATMRAEAQLVWDSLTPSVRESLLPEDGYDVAADHRWIAWLAEHAASKLFDVGTPGGFERRLAPTRKLLGPAGSQVLFKAVL